MYLTSAQHDQLRTLIMGFEIPYRSYIAEVILDTYHDKCSFSTALTNAQLSNCQPVLNNTIKNQIIKAQKNPDKLFDALQFANNSFTTKSVAGSADVPMLGELNVLTYVFQQNFSCLVNIFPCFSDYRLNQFAEKYIIQRFLPDAVQYAALQERVERCVRQTDRELRMFDDAVKRNPERQKILMDWNIFTNGDKIAAAKIDLIYIDVREQCNKGNKFFVRTALEDAYPKINLLEKTSIHPYIQYQKARILKMIDDSGILPEKHDEEIQEVYKNVIWSIKTNPLYSCIQHTKSYAAILWIYGMRLIPDDIGAATRYLEDAKSTFEECGIVDAEYVNCLSDLLQAYLKSYGYTKNKSYLHSARPIDRKIMEFSRKPKHFWQWHDELKRY